VHVDEKSISLGNQVLTDESSITINQSFMLC